MNKNLTELVYILDMSGSMDHLRDDTIGGYNTMIEDQRKVGQDNPAMKANVTTVLFDHRYIMLHDRENIDNVKKMTEKEYCPNGTTAMLDAIGRTVVSVGQKLAATPEEERPGLVSVTIITDGMENASKEYTWQAVRDMIKEQREKYSWVFTFIGANIDVEKTSDDLGIDRDFAKAYTPTGAGINTVYTSISNGSTSLRGSIAASTCVLDSLTMSAVSKTTLAKSLDDIQ